MRETQRERGEKDREALDGKNMLQSPVYIYKKYSREILRISSFFFFFFLIIHIVARRTYKLQAVISTELIILRRSNMCVCV